MSAAVDDAGTAAPTAVACVGIVVVTYGAHELLARNLAPLDLESAGARVVVVDNFHSPGERAAIALTCAEHGWDFVPVATNIGFGPANNLGAARAFELGCDAVLILNPDAKVDGPVVRALAEACAADPMRLVCPRIVRPDGRVWFDGGSLDLRAGFARHATDGTSAWLTGACLMVHRDLWTALGGFDPDFFLYWEDVDLSRRCVELGGRLEVRRDLEVVHEVGGTQGGAKSAVYYYYNCRNRLLFAAKHLDRRGILRWVVGTPAASTRIFLRGGRRKIIRTPGLIWPAVRGSLVGLGAALTALVRGPHGRARW